MNLSGYKEILVIDDCKPVRMILHRALERADASWRVREMETGAQALGDAETLGNAGLIIADLEMPGLEASDFLRQLTQHPALQGKPILVLSGEFPAEIQEAYGHLRTIRLLQKPCPSHDIVEVARHLLEEGAP
ncbi:MAG TPA: response regulator [bacterium]|jgi:CheY-like chemotaxis protein|nr:response regulator [bacterium]